MSSPSALPIDQTNTSPLLTWTNVFIAFFFILFDATLSHVFNLNIGTSLIISSFRCVIQLTLMGMILGSVFASDSILAIFGIVLVLNMLGAVEVTFNKAKGRYDNMVCYE
jgi:ABC-type iron transport system FetAB permease component